MANNKKRIPFGVDDPRVVEAWSSLPKCCRKCVAGPPIPIMGGVAVVIVRRKEGATDSKQSDFAIQESARNLIFFGDLFREAQRAGWNDPCSKGKKDSSEACPIANMAQTAMGVANYGLDNPGSQSLAYTNFYNRAGVGFKPPSED